METELSLVPNQTFRHAFSPYHSLSFIKLLYIFKTQKL